MDFADCYGFLRRRFALEIAHESPLMRQEPAGGIDVGLFGVSHPERKKTGSSRTMSYLLRRYLDPQNLHKSVSNHLLRRYLDPKGPRVSSKSTQRGRWSPGACSNARICQVCHVVRILRPSSTARPPHVGRPTSLADRRTPGRARNGAEAEASRQRKARKRDRFLRSTEWNIIIY